VGGVKDGPRHFFLLEGVENGDYENAPFRGERMKEIHTHSVVSLLETGKSLLFCITRHDAPPLPSESLSLFLSCRTILAFHLPAK